MKKLLAVLILTAGYGYAQVERMGAKPVNGASISPSDVTTTGDVVVGGQLVVTGTATVKGNAFSVGASTLAVVGGNVGVGTTAPGRKLELSNGEFIISDDAVAHGMTLVAPTNAFARMSINSGGSGGLYFQGLTEDATNPLTFRGVVGAASTTQGAIELIGATKSGTAAGGMAATNPVLIIKEQGGTEVARFLAGGNVGIGTTNPLSLLQMGAINTAVGANPGGLGILNASGPIPLILESPSTDSTNVRINNTSTDGRHWIFGTVGSAYPARVGRFFIHDATDGVTALDFLTNGDAVHGPQTATASTITVTGRIQMGGTSGNSWLAPGGGNVGIGTAAPATKLHMSSGTLTIDGNTAASITTSGSASIGTTLVVTSTPTFSKSTSPAAADACTAGQFVWDASYIYICTASGAWKRAALTGGY